MTKVEHCGCLEIERERDGEREREEDGGERRGAEMRKVLNKYCGIGKVSAKKNEKKVTHTHIKFRKFLLIRYSVCMCDAEKKLHTSFQHNTTAMNCAYFNIRNAEYMPIHVGCTYSNVYLS